MHPSNCLDPRMLQRLLDQELEASESTAVQGHLSQCRDCRDRLSSLLDESAGLLEERAPEELKRVARQMVPETRSSSRTWLPLAAMLVLALGAGLMLRSGDPQEAAPTDVLRKSEERSSFELDAPAPHETPAGLATTFRWKPVENARRYEITLVNEIGDVLFEASTTESSIEVPHHLLALENGGAFYWSVRALLSDGSRVESPLSEVAF